MLQNFPVVVPPKEEQAAIAEHLKRAATSIDTTIDRALKEIELLREFRSRLIIDIVTGKIDVREAALKLPGELEEPELIDEVNDIADIDNEVEVFEEELEEVAI